jgi:hypothetical protein
MLLWLAIMLYAVSWLYAFGLYTPARLDGWVLAFGAGTACALAFCVRMAWSAGQVPRSMLVFRCFLGRSVTILAPQYLVLLAYERLVVYAEASPALAMGFAKLATLAGLDATHGAGSLYVQTQEKLLALSLTPEKLGLMTLLMVLGAGALVVLPGLTRGRLVRATLLLVSTGVVYLLLRFIGLLFLLKDYEQLNLFWNPSLILLQFLPLVGVLSVLLPMPSGAGAMRTDLDRGVMAARMPVIALLVIISFLLTTAVTHIGPGQKKSGRVLIDEAHSDWAWTDVRFGPESFGQRPTYSYTNLKDLLSYYYDVSVNESAVIDQTRLQNVDVLIIKTPTAPFLLEEADAIEAFVKEGGGLFLIGDHTNLFGMTTNINPLADRFGIRFFSDDTFELSSGQPTTFRPPLLAPHPAVQHMEKMNFETSCTLTAPLFAQHVMVGRALGREQVDYSHVNFFGNMKADPQDGFGSFLQAVAVPYGRGRVLAFSDSTIFSNFSLFKEGRVELLLGTIDYLNRKQTTDWVAWSAAVLAFVMGIGAAVLMVRGPARISIGSTMAAVVLGMIAGRAVVGLMQSVAYPKPVPRESYEAIVFEREFSNFSLPSMIEYRPSSPQMSFDTFFVNMQRLGLFPRIKTDFEETVSSTRPIVIINPEGVVSKRQMTELESYLRDGGRALFLLNHSGPFFAANALLNSGGLGVFPRLEPIAPDREESGQTETSSAQTFQIVGGDPVVLPSHLLPAGEQTPFVVRKTVGKGVVVVVLGAEIFSHSGMGPVFHNPDETQRNLYRLE